MPFGALTAKYLRWRDVATKIITMTQLAIISNEEVQSASNILATTQTWVQKYTAKESLLLEKANKEGDKLTPDTDQEINDFLAGVKKATKAAEELRKPFTSKLQTVVKLFTAEETLLGELMPRLQTKRNTSAGIYAKEAVAKQAADQLILDKKNEEIRLFAEAEQFYRDSYATILRDDKALLLSALEEATGETIGEVEELLAGVVGTLHISVWEDIICEPSATIVPVERAIEIGISAKAGKFEKIAPHYQSEIKAYAEHLLSMVPERVKELEEGKESDALAALKIKEEETAAAQAEQSAQRLQTEVQSATSAAAVDMQINQSLHAMTVPKAQTVESYSITVVSRTGWMEIANFYFQNAPFTESVEEMGKVKLDSMKLFAERYAKSTGTMINSTNITYVEQFKAITKTKKAA